MKSILINMAMSLITAICGIVVLFCGILAPKTWLAVTDIVLALVDFLIAYRLYKTATDTAKAMDEYLIHTIAVTASLASMHGIKFGDSKDSGDEKEESLEDFINKCNGKRQ